MACEKTKYVSWSRNVVKLLLVYGLKLMNGIYFDFLDDLLLLLLLLLLPTPSWVLLLSNLSSLRSILSCRFLLMKLLRLLCSLLGAVTGKSSPLVVSSDWLMRDLMVK